MHRIGLEELSKETLIKLVRVYSHNWQTLDGLWFSNVEAVCGLNTAVDIDLRNWEKQAVIEAKRIKEALQLDNGGLSEVLTVLSFMSWQLTSPMFECEGESPSRVIIKYPHCAVQKSRARKTKPLFPCKNMKMTLLSNIAKVIEPAASVTCLSCPPDSRHTDYWCRWELSLINAVAK